MFIEINLVALLIIVLIIFLIYKYVKSKQHNCQSHSRQENIRLKTDSSEEFDNTIKPDDSFFNNETRLENTLETSVFEGQSKYLQDINKAKVPLIRGSATLLPENEEYPTNPRVGIQFRSYNVKLNDANAQALDVNTSALTKTKNIA